MTIIKVKKKIRGQLYWGYLDSDGQIFVKKYTGDRVIENFERLPFVKGIFDPFEAYDLNHARELIFYRFSEELVKEDMKNEKKRM